MKRIMRRLKHVNGIARYSYYFFLVVYLISFLLFTINLINLSGIETVLRIILIVTFFFYFLFYILYGLLNLLTRKYKKYILISLVTLIFISIFNVSSYFIGTIYGGLSNIFEQDKELYTTYLIKLKDTKFNSEGQIGRIDNQDDTEGYVLTEKLIKKYKLKNEIVDYSDYDDMILNLYAGKIAAAFVPSNYLALFTELDENESIADKTTVIYKYQEKKKDSTGNKAISNKDFNDPLTFLIMGVDSTKNNLDPNAGFNGDTLMFIAFNPKTLDSLVLSIPRDTYVPITCNQNRYAKINSSAAFGSECVVNTVSSLLTTDIDYYVKVNFKGVVNLVDALDGIEVDVEAPTYGADQYNGQVCEQNSDREFGNKLVCIKPGHQTLNGEQALAYARNRHLYIGSDLDRVRHQQQIVEAVARKLLNFATVTDFKKIFNAISNNIATNMATDKILSGYEVVKDMTLKALNGQDFININKATLETYSLPVYRPATGGYTSAQGYYQDSLTDIQNTIKIYLGLQDQETIKTFSFSVNEPFVEHTAGKGLKQNPSLELMPNLIGSDISKAEEFCQKHNLTLNKEYVNPGEAHYNADVAPGLIGDQDARIGTLIKELTSLTIYIPNSGESNKNSSNNTSKEENKTETEEDCDEKNPDLGDVLNLF